MVYPMAATKDITVLVFPCGSEIGLELHEALKDIRFINLIGASSVKDHASFVYKNYIEGLPYLSDPAFDDAFRSLVEREGVDVVFPALDDAIVKLAEISDSLPCKVLGCEPRTADICRDKELTYQVFSNCWFNPVTYSDADAVRDYPVVIKPAIGQGSAGVKIVHSYDELSFELSNRQERTVICEYLPGEEYTIDCFTDRHGALRYTAQRTRGRTKAGISVNSVLMEPDETVRAIAEEINSMLSLRGMWFFQLKRNSLGEYRLLEVAPRVAGTMCLERAIGVNLPLLAIFDAMDSDIDVLPQFSQCEVDRSLGNVFRVPCDYRSVYLDFDDTLVKDGQVVLKTVSFVYQCVNRGIPIMLLSRHERDIHESLKKAKLSESLFSQIVILQDGEKKSDYIDTSLDPIFIDDSFAERRDVSKRLGIKVFGLDNLEVLISKRE